MRKTRSKASYAGFLALALTVPAVALGPGGPAAAAPDNTHQPAAETAVLSALQRDLHLTAEQATRLMQQQSKAIEADRILEQSLGDDFGGSWFDARTGKLTVAVTAAGRRAEVTGQGAEVRVVQRGEKRLKAITAELDALSGKASSTSRKAPPGKRSAALAGLVAWQTDPQTDKVVVTAIKGQLKAAALAKYGDAVRIEYVDRAPQPAAFMDGGDELNGGRCSAGFNLRNKSTGQGYLLTAGHCYTGGNSVTGQGGVYFGPVLESFFPTWDDALIRNDNPGYWVQGPWADINPSNGGIVSIANYTDAPVGTPICKTGITTKLTCGTITAKDSTINYAAGPVYGATQHNACVELGDSGGANFALTTYPYPAEGVTSGAILYENNRCGGNTGRASTSWYFPIADSLAYYGPRYNISTW